MSDVLKGDNGADAQLVSSSAQQMRLACDACRPRSGLQRSPCRGGIGSECVQREGDFDGMQLEEQYSW